MCRALCEQATARASGRCYRRADGRGGPPAPPGQNADRLLQGREAPGEPRAHLLHFLGFTFRGRKAPSRNGGYITGFLPAMSTEALKAKSTELRAMRIHRRTTDSL